MPGSLALEETSVLLEGSLVGDADVDLSPSGMDERRHGQMRSAAVSPPISALSSTVVEKQRATSQRHQ